MNIRGKLSDKEKEICNNFIKTGNKRTSFLLAGLKPSNQNTITKFFEKKKVTDYLEFCTELADSAITQSEVINAISKIARRLETEDYITVRGEIINQRQSIKDQLKALELMCKLMNIENINGKDSSITIIDDIINDYDDNEENIITGIE